MDEMTEPRLTVCLSFDVDTVSLWLGTDDHTAMSRGEFGAVAVPRILDLLATHGAAATFFVPGLTAETYPAVVKSIIDAGHEIGHHGWRHENPARLDPDGERAALARGLEVLRETVGVTPRGWRSPGWYTTAHSLPLLIEHDFVYDSSLMGHDVEPYWAPIGGRWSREAGYEPGEASGLVELPIHWSLDDFPYFEYIPPRGGGLNPASVVEEIWRDDFDWAYANAPGGVMTITMHPQVIGRGHRLAMLDRLMRHMAGHDGVAFSTMLDAACRWAERQGGSQESVRGGTTGGPQSAP
jgi:peptidoglycan/xylan/chitin deacetylase (PgdA/CDA1 family)